MVPGMERVYGSHYFHAISCPLSHDPGAGWKPHYVARTPHCRKWHRIRYLSLFNAGKKKRRNKTHSLALTLTCILTPNHYPTSNYERWMSTICSLGMRLCGHLCTQLENCILRNMQLLWIAYGVGKLQVLKTLFIASRWCTHCVRANTTVNTWTIFELTWLVKIVMTWSGTLATTHFCA